jgi:hypothetical protein
MLIVLSLFFLLVWLVFIKFQWLPFNRNWKIIIYESEVAQIPAAVVQGQVTVQDAAAPLRR